MAVGPGISGPLLPVPGVRIGVVEAGIRKRNRKDVVLFELASGSSVSGVFTRNAFCAAPVQVAKTHLRAAGSAGVRAWLVNTGCANAGTGEPGLADALASCEVVAGLLSVPASAVLPFSTGVIGERLPMQPLQAALPAAVSALAADNWLTAAEGIMTTDTRPKGISRAVAIGEHTITITGISKGAGMIRPDMATMLAFVATDARVAVPDLDAALLTMVDQSFNRISVDGDTSTNDACMLVATGLSEVALAPGSPGWDDFVAALRDVFVWLAQAIVRDGEGATKFVTVTVQGGADASECLRAAYAIAESPLVKTALFASDPNWGRILAAIGRSGIEALDTSRIDIYLNEVQIVSQGGRAPAYTEAQGQAAMAPEEIVIRVELGRGGASESVWTCDFSHDYVTINAEYRT